MASMKDAYIYMPRNNEELEFVVGEYTDMGLPGCVGSVDVVHIGWDACPNMFFTAFTGKERYCSITYELICSSSKLIQSVSYHHPGANDKHMQFFPCRLLLNTKFLFGLNELALTTLHSIDFNL